MFTNVDAVRAAYEGRMGRTQFIPLAIIIFIVEIVLNLFVINPLSIMFGGLGSAISLLIVLVFAFATLHVYVRRLHDIGQSGWWVLLGMVPNYGIFLTMLLTLVLAVKSGDMHANEYGPKLSRDKSPLHTFFNN